MQVKALGGPATGKKIRVKEKAIDPSFAPDSSGNSISGDVGYLELEEPIAAVQPVQFFGIPRLNINSYPPVPGFQELQPHAAVTLAGMTLPCGQRGDDPD